MGTRTRAKVWNAEKGFHDDLHQIGTRMHCRLSVIRSQAQISNQMTKVMGGELGDERVQGSVDQQQPSRRE